MFLPWPEKVAFKQRKPHWRIGSLIIGISFRRDRSPKCSETRQDGLRSKERAERVYRHGLRYAFAQESYTEALEKHLALGESQADAEYHARVDVSRELGHGSDEITLIYLP